jgi:hypothetical protein
MPTVAHTIPADEKDLLVKLWVADEHNHRPGEALLDATQLDRARAWLRRILADGRARETHTDWLCEVCQTTFRPALPRRICEGLEPPQPAPDPRFAHRTLLPEACVAQILKEGVEELPADTVGPLLLNPYALWDLADRIYYEMPDYWLPLLDEVGRDLMQEWGIDFEIPGVDPKLSKRNDPTGT